MERATALKKLGKLLGKGLAWRINPKAPPPEEREAARAEFPQAIARRDEMREQKQARYKAILDADAEYYRLKVELASAQGRVDVLSGKIHGRKITVGINNGIFFHVKAEGDSWEDVIAKLQA